jgi:hypothetical protein
LAFLYEDKTRDFLLCMFLALTLLFVTAELFLTLYVLFGIERVAPRDLNFTSTQRMDIPGERPISQQVPCQQVPYQQVSSQQVPSQQVSRISEPNNNIDIGRNPFSTSFSGQGALSEPLETHEAQSV